MPSKIRVLDENTINKIAAGEVIENPSSVVKELVENSLDAGATEITIEIKGGGRQLIRITDNGCGMNRDDALLCLERHATSKLREIDGIHNLGTMGFRGEAIPSIASISKFTLYTRVNASASVSTPAPTSDTENPNPQMPGTLIIINGGKILTCSDVECEKGTTIEIKELFFNVPVRKKFQKSPIYDTTEIQRIVTQLALGNPQICFQLITNGEILFSAPHIAPNSTFSEALKERIRHLLGEEVYHNIIPLKTERGDFQIEGYIGFPAIHRHNRSGQHLFVNRRGVIVPLVSFAVRDGYGTMLPSGRHPVFVLHLTMPPELIDVNVHPQKREVRLRQERLLKDVILFSVETSLQQSNSLTSYSVANPSMSPTSFQDEFKFPKPPSAPSFNSNFSVELPSWSFSDIDAFTTETDSEPYLKPNIAPSPPPPKIHQSTTPWDAPTQPDNQPLLFETSPPQIDLPPTKKFKAIGMLQHYIVATENDSTSMELFLIDQRAAHARILYEKMLQDNLHHPSEMQLLLIPHLLHLSSVESACLREQLNTLNSLSIHIKEFGPTSFVVEALPQLFGNVDIQKLIEEIVLSSSEKNHSTLIEAEQKRKLAQAASRSAIHVNDRLNLSQAQQLLDQLVQCKTLHLCPNGKIVIFRLKASDIAKLSAM